MSEVTPDNKGNQGGKTPYKGNQHGSAISRQPRRRRSCP